MFGMIFALALYLAYLRQIDTDAVVYGCLAIVMGVVVGGASGLAVGRLVDAAYWASLCSALGYLATAAEPTFDTEFRLAWAAVGTAAGAGANLVDRERPPSLSRICAGAGSRPRISDGPARPAVERRGNPGDQRHRRRA